MEQRKQAPGFASGAEYDEAYRNAHNFLAAYEGVATLKPVLETLVNARQQYDALQAALQAGQREQRDLDTALGRLREQEQKLGGEVKRRQDEADTAHQAHLAQLHEEQEAIAGPLRAARQELRDAQAQAAQVRATMRQQAEREQRQQSLYHQGILEQLQEEQTTLREENARLSAQKARFLADLSEMVGRVDVARGA